jgi:hypothetical protein
MVENQDQLAQNNKEELDFNYPAFKYSEIISDIIL